MKKLIVLLVAAFLTTGCITYNVVENHAKTHEKSTLVEGEHPEGAPYLAKWKTETVPGQPGYYALVPLTVAADVATLPVQVPYGIYLIVAQPGP